MRHLGRLFLYLLILCAPARVLLISSAAEFSTATVFSSTADFSTAAEFSTAAITSTPQENGDPALILESAGPFLLLDRPDPRYILMPPPSSTGTAAAAPANFLQFEEQFRPFNYSLDAWTQARDHLEAGQQPREAVIESIEENIGISSGVLAVIKPPPPEFELPDYGTSLSVMGRKTIGFSYTEKKYLHAQTVTGAPMTSTALNITQQLQMRMQGKVGPRISVNVDYNDAVAHHDDVNVVYNGKPGEAVQNVSFGDIDLALPPTEFLSYDKQLFGISGKVKYHGLSGVFIASRQMGTNKEKQFIGNTQFVQTNISDISYLQEQYYDLTFGAPGRLPILAGSEKVYLATLQPMVVNTNNVVLTAEDLTSTAAVVTSTFTQLVAGVNYTIDYVHGVLKLTQPTQQGYAIAIDYIDATGHRLSIETSSNPYQLGGDGNPRLIKTPGDVPIPDDPYGNLISTSTQLGWDRELKTWYFLGQAQIIPDNGQGNFFIRVENQNQQLVGPNLNPPEEYPQTISVDFPDGLFYLQQPFQIQIGTVSELDPQIYNQPPVSKYIIHVEYSFRLKTFLLDPNIAPLSDVVLLDGRRLTRNVDYFIDYTSGFITFFNPGMIGPTSVLNISYEVEPGAGLSNVAILGGGLGYKFNDHFSIGSTVLYQAGNQSPTAPEITAISGSILDYDGTVKLQNIDLLGHYLQLKDLSLEAAQSRYTPNLNSVAIVDNMEGVGQDTTANLLWTNWNIASNPIVPVGTTINPLYNSSYSDPNCSASGCTFGGLTVNESSYNVTDPTLLTWGNEYDPILSINPSAAATPQQTQTVLDMNYNFSDPLASNQASLVYVFSTQGIDFSQKTALKVTMLGDNSGNTINFRLGSISEDADASGILRTNDTDGDGIVSPQEDIGWLYQTPIPGFPSKRFFPNMGVIESDDLNRNGILDPDAFDGGNYGYLGNQAPFGQTGLFDETDNSSHTVIDFGPGASNSKDRGWQTFLIPLNISTADVTSWNAIHEIRVTVRWNADCASNNNGTCIEGAAPSSGTIKIANIDVVGTSWQPGQPIDPATDAPPIGFASMTVVPVNNVDDPSYIPIYNAGGVAEAVFDQEYGSIQNLQQQSNTQNIQEQSLALHYYDLNTASAVVTTKEVFPQPIDISQHRRLHFLLYPNAQEQASGGGQYDACESSMTFFMRFGADQSYWEVQVPLSQTPPGSNETTGWEEVNIDQIMNGYDVASGWQVGAGSPPGTTVDMVQTYGIPSLQTVGEIVVGLRNTGGNCSTSYGGATTGTGIVYVDEIFVSQPVVRIGNAHDYQADFVIPGVASFGIKDRSIDQNWLTPTTVVSNQDNEQTSAYLNITKFNFLPMSFNVMRTITDTPSEYMTGTNSNLVNLLQQGTVTTWNETANAAFVYGALPHLNVNALHTNTHYDALDRTDDTKTLNATLQYTLASRLPILPKSISANYSYTRYSVQYDSMGVLESSMTPVYDQVDFTHTMGLQMSFVPWTGSTFDPNYSLSTTFEDRNDWSGDIAPYGVGQKYSAQYPKALTETAGFTSNWKLNRWLNPQVNYTANISENNLLNVSSNAAVMISTNTNGTISISTNYYVYGVGQLMTYTRTANGTVALPLAIGDIFRSSKLLRSMNITMSYQLNDGDGWENLPMSGSDQWAFWLRTPIHTSDPFAQLANYSFRDDYLATLRWAPLSAYDLHGRWKALKTFSFLDNYVYSVNRTGSYDSVGKSISQTLPDVTANLSDIQDLLGISRWFGHTTANVRYQAHQNTTVGSTYESDSQLWVELRTLVLKRYDTLLSVNTNNSQTDSLVTNTVTQTVGHIDATLQTTFIMNDFTITPKVYYAKDTTVLGTGQATNNTTTLTPSLLVRGDFKFPEGLKLPFTNTVFTMVNRLLWTTTLSYSMQSSPVITANNNRTWSLTTNADYQVAKNLRVILNGGFTYLTNPYLPQYDYMSLTMGANMVFQF